MSEEDGAIVEESVEEETVAEVESDAAVENVDEIFEEVAESQEDEEPAESPTAKIEEGVQKRIDKLTKIRREQEREIAVLKANAAQTVNPVPSAPVEVKSFADFDYDEEKYQKHVNEQARANALREVQETTARERAKSVQAEFSKRETQFSNTIDDYQQVARADSLPVSPVMARAVTTSDIGPQVLYHLGQNPDIALKIYQMEPVQAVIEMGKIEAKLSVKPQAKKVSSAPKPAPKIKPTNSKVEKRLTDPMSQAEFEKMRRKTIAAR